MLGDSSCVVTHHLTILGLRRFNGKDLIGTKKDSSIGDRRYGISIARRHYKSFAELRRGLRGIQTSTCNQMSKISEGYTSSLNQKKIFLQRWQLVVQEHARNKVISQMVRACNSCCSNEFWVLANCSANTCSIFVLPTLNIYLSFLPK